jgi:hypothetical protein
MAEKDEQPEDGLDDFDKAARLSFRDYPSTSLVLIAALSSGVGWMLYKWRRRRRTGQPTVPYGGETEGNATKAVPPADGSA